MKQILLSIIVPVYGVEKYIEECITNIIKQLTSEVELIVVNDKTLDHSMNICRAIINRYVEKQNNIKIIERIENGGPSAARNSGIDVASGKYCWFVDSDDCINEGAIELLISKIQTTHFDMLQFNHSRFKNKEKIASSCLSDGDTFINNSQERLKYMCDYLLNNQNSGREVWRRLYSLDIIRKYGLRFESNKTIAEDICFHLYYLSYCNYIVSIKEDLYNYRVWEGSIMGMLSKPKLREMQQIAKSVYIFMPNLYIKERFHLLYAGIMQIHYNMVRDDDIDAYYENLNDAAFVIEMNNAIKRNIKMHYIYFGRMHSALHFLWASLLVNKNKNKKVCCSMIKKVISLI